MIFRDFVEQTKDAIHTLAGGLEAQRPLTPMLHLESAGTVEIFAVDGRYFESPGSKQRLVEAFVIPLVRDHQATKVAWTFSASIREVPWSSLASDEPYEAVMATFIDRERSEVWAARVHRPPAGVPFVGDWQAGIPNQAEGPLLIQPIQEALR